MASLADNEAKRGPVAPDALAARELVRTATASREELVEISLDAIDHRDADLHAWAHIDPSHARRQARSCGSAGILDGVCIGVKDIIDTVDLPTEYGSPIYRGHRPTVDASCVSALSRAGAIIVGKTVTTELAFTEPAITRNPIAPHLTPGASSCGSAAAVADGMVAIAIGTQLSASIVRPASYCGVLGFKPTLGTISTAGIKPASATLDTVGVFARTVDDLALAYCALAPPEELQLAELARPPRLGLVRTAQSDQADTSAHDVFDLVARTVEQAGGTIEDRVTSPPLDALPHAQECVGTYDMARALSHEQLHAPQLLSATVKAMIQQGLEIGPGERAAAITLRDQAAYALPELFGRCDALLTFAVTGEPPSRSSTGDPVFGRAWTFLGLPCVCLPGGLGPNGLPIGVQLVGRHGTDQKLLEIAKWVIQRLPIHNTGKSI